MLRKKLIALSVIGLIVFSIAGCGCEHTNSVILKRDQHCEGEGTITYKCQDCGKEYDETAPALGHDYSTFVSDTATCEKSGYSTYKCTRCGALNKKVSEAKGHDYDLAKCKRCNAINENYKEGTVNYKSGKYTLTGSGAYLYGWTVGLVQCWYDLIEGDKKINFTISAQNLTRSAVQVGIILCDGNNKFLGTKILTYFVTESSYIQHYEFDMLRIVKEGEKCYYWIEVTIVR